MVVEVAALTTKEQKAYFHDQIRDLQEQIKSIVEEKYSEQRGDGAQ